jgi:hypothetical protein
MLHIDYHTYKKIYTHLAFPTSLFQMMPKRKLTTYYNPRKKGNASGREGDREEEGEGEGEGGEYLPDIRVVIALPFVILLIVYVSDVVTPLRGVASMHYYAMQYVFVYSTLWSA